jgi:hypothetical protein
MFQWHLLNSMSLNHNLYEVAPKLLNLALSLLLILSPAANAVKVDLSIQRVVPNASNTGDYSRLFEELKGNHLVFTLNVPAHNVRLQVNYYQQVDVTGKDFTIPVIKRATELFFDWMIERKHTITNNRRDHRFLSVYDLDENTLNDFSIVNFTSIAKKNQTHRRVNALYEAHHTHNDSNALLIAANRNDTEISRATTIAHELAHWWCDYFRIYDRYYIGENGKADMEGPAYDFQRYFQERYRVK